MKRRQVERQEAKGGVDRLLKQKERQMQPNRWTARVQQPPCGGSGPSAAPSLSPCPLYVVVCHGSIIAFTQYAYGVPDA